MESSNAFNMNLFNYEFGTVLSYVEEVYTRLYGEQYRKLICDRLQNAKYIFYDENSDTDFYEKSEKEGFDFNDEDTRKALLPIKNNSEIVVLPTIDEEQLLGVMFFPISRLANGRLDFFFLHECGHIVDQSNFCSIGFDKTNDYHYVNPAESGEFEILNEALTDIFAIECRDLLHKSDIYLADKDKLTLDSENDNIRHEIKELVRLLVDDYRKEIIAAKLTGNYDILYDKIGKENFDSFNLVINKVQRLIDDGLLISKNQEQNIQYYELIEEAEAICNNMTKYNTKSSAKR